MIESPIASMSDTLLVPLAEGPGGIILLPENADSDTGSSLTTGFGTSFVTETGIDTDGPAVFASMPSGDAESPTIEIAPLDELTVGQAGHPVAGFVANAAPSPDGPAAPAVYSSDDSDTDVTSTITVSTIDELYAALAESTGGETILLEGGNYGELSLWDGSGIDVKFPANVTIASADPGNPASFSSVALDGCSNLTFDGVIFDYTFNAGDAEYVKPFQLTDSQNITITNSIFDGDLAQGVSQTSDGYGYGYGLNVRGCSDITISNNEVYDFTRAMVFMESSGLTVTGNDIHSVRSDGLNFVEVTDVLIEGNYIHDFSGALDSTDHRDMIQFWTNGTDSPSTDIVIQGNHLDVGNGVWTQSIFMRNEAVDSQGAGVEMYYLNVTIKDNVVVNAHINAILVGETDALTISNNTVIHDDGGAKDGLDAAMEIPVISVVETATNVTITDNLVESVDGYEGQDDWVVDGNIHIQDQDPNQDGWYDDVFVSTSLEPVDGVLNPIALPGGSADVAGAGAESTLQPQFNTLEAHYQVISSPTDATARAFDANVSLYEQDQFPDGTIFSWDFGDGTSAQGASLTHVYADPGNYQVTLTIILPNGISDDVTSTVSIADPRLLAMQADGSFLAWEDGGTIAISGGPESSSAGLQLGADGTTLTISRDHLRDIVGPDDVQIDFSIKADSATSAGEVFQMPNSFIVYVTSAGELELRAFDPSGNEDKATTSGAHLNDQSSHDISIHLLNGQIAIIVDGVELASMSAPDGFGYTASHDLYFGNPWGGENFQGTLSAFEVTANADDFGITETIGADAGTSMMLSLDQEGDIAVWYDGEVQTLDGGQTTDSDGIHVDGPGQALTLDAAYFQDIGADDEFSFSFTLTADSAGSSGQLMALPGSFFIKINANGEMVLAVRDDDGVKHKLVTTGAGLDDMASHDISIVLADGTVGIIIDDEVLESDVLPDGLNYFGEKDFFIGSSGENRAFTCEISELTISSTVTETEMEMLAATQDDFLF